MTNICAAFSAQTWGLKTPALASLHDIAGSESLVTANDLNNGREVTHAYNKNNNAAVGVERRYLYANTD